MRKRIFCIILALAMVFALCACGSNETEKTQKAIIGKWVSADIDGTDAFLKGFYENDGTLDADTVDFLESCTFRPIKFRYTLTINEKDFKLYIDKECVDTITKNITEDLGDSFLNYFTDILAAEMGEIGFTLEDILEIYEVNDTKELVEMIIEESIEDFVAEIMQDAELEEIFNNMGYSGTYKVKGADIVFEGDGTGDVAVYAEAGDTITMTGENDDNLEVYPLVFHRA